MASNTQVVSAVPSTIFDFNTTRRGTVTLFSNDLNITFSSTAQAPGVLQRLHTGPILFAVNASVGANVRVVVVAQSIGNAFPAPPLSLLQIQTDTVVQI